jgi:hypothetical protein
MGHLSPVLVDAFEREIQQSLREGPPLREALTWLRYYLDSCAKHDEPSRDRESLGPFLKKLASKVRSGTHR